MPRPASSKASVSLDQAIKELLQLRPLDTLAFLLPEVIPARGSPQEWTFHNIQVRKRDLTRKGLVMDLNIEYTFPGGAPLLLVLVEHWSTARSIDLLRTAQYYLDLCHRFPDHEIVPVALVTEIESPPVPGGFARHALGETFLTFRTRVVQLSCTQAENWAQARNLVATTLLMAMGGGLPRAERLERVIAEYLSLEEALVKLLFPLLTQVGKFTDMEHNVTIKHLTRLPKPLFMEIMEREAIERGLAKGMEQGMEQGVAQGVAQGIRAKALEDARKMREHGIDWAIITDVTGLKPEDLKG